MTAKKILSTYVHTKNDGTIETIPVSDSYWAEWARGKHPHLDEGKLLGGFTFSTSWSTWQRYPAGEALIMLLSGNATIVLEEEGRERAVPLGEPGAYILVPQNVWHTAETETPTTILFLSPGAMVEHREYGV